MVSNTINVTYVEKHAFRVIPAYGKQDTGKLPTVKQEGEHLSIHQVFPGNLACPVTSIRTGAQWLWETVHFRKASGCSVPEQCHWFCLDSGNIPHGKQCSEHPEVCQNQWLHLDQKEHILWKENKISCPTPITATPSSPPPGKKLLYLVMEHLGSVPWD